MRGFDRLGGLATWYVTGIFRISCHRIALDSRDEAERVGGLNVEEPGLLHVVFFYAIRKGNTAVSSRVQDFMKPIQIVSRDSQIKAMPCPIKAGIGFPL